MYVCTFVFMYVCVCVYVYMYVCMYVCVCTYVCMYVCMYTSMYICMYVCHMHTCIICTGMYVCMHAHVCLYASICAHDMKSCKPTHAHRYKRKLLVPNYLLLKLRGHYVVHHSSSPLLDHFCIIFD